MKLKKGRTIIHPRQGACKVKQVLPGKVVLSSCFHRGGGLTIFIPKGSVDQIGLRVLSSKKVVSQALRNLEIREIKIVSQEVKLSQEKLRQWFEEGNLENLSRTILELYKKVWIDKEGYVSQAKLLKGAVDLLAEEIAAVQQMTKKEARKEILGRLKITFGG